MVMINRFVNRVDFNALSLRDLADARDAYHVHLANLTNVVGTALGRYLIRRDDPRFTNPDAASPSWSKKPRTFTNSAITKWSWPCVLVFVREWMVDPPGADGIDQVIPNRLYLPDGRQVPTCVVHTPLGYDEDRQPQLRFGSITKGPGLPLFADEQGRRRMGTIGALVTDGSRVYALTSRHVLGPAGSVVAVAQQGRTVPIGRVATEAARRSLQSLYPGIAATRAELDLDAGLVELESVDGWTSQLYGLGVIGDLIDLNVDTVGLSLIGCPVKATGAASGPLRGSILGLFHRWRSVGGVDEIAELLIGPRAGDDDIDSRPGDSGALWVWDEQADAAADGGPEVRRFASRSLPVVNPMALQWGGQVVLDAAGGQPTDYVLASTLAGVVQTLGVTLLTDDTLADHSLYWGKVGHYKIAGSACELGPAGTKLAQLLTANLDRIAVSDDDISSGQLPSAADRTKFIALADVPDLVWRSDRPKDAPSHFADMDEPGGGVAERRTLLQLWDSGEPNWRTPQGWTDFYNDLPKPPEDKHRGSLPFRVAQLYDIMVDSVRQEDVTQYVAAAGVLAHYVGDACQPLHVSRLHHGEPDDPSDDGVHEAYETTMLDHFAPEVVSGVNKTLDGYHAGDAGGPDLFKGSDHAADTVVALMKRTFAAIAPRDILDAYDSHPGAGRTKALWDTFHEATIQRLADGARTLAVIWRSAWEEGGGEDLAASKMTAQSTSALQKLYEDKTFAPNAWLKDWAELSQPTSPPKRRRGRSK
jgi:hypothetical protein